MVRLWHLFSTGSGAGFLPESGGVMDQASIMMDAFALMSNFSAQLDKERGK